MIFKNNKVYITESIDEDEYYDYIDFIENSKASFDLNNSIRFKKNLLKESKRLNNLKNLTFIKVRPVIYQKVNMMMMNKLTKQILKIL